MPEVRAIAVTLAVLSAGWPAAAGAQQSGSGLIDVYDQFVVASAAATACLAPDPDRISRQLETFWAIQRRVEAEQISTRPGVPAYQINGELLDRARRMRSRILAYIDGNGCDDPAVVDLVMLFLAQSDWLPDGAY